MMEYTNFAECGERWMREAPGNQTLVDLYGWTGAVHHIPKNLSTQISTWGCKQFCGTGTDYYQWTQSSATITTWILPVIGLLVQAPFVSNAFWDTVFSISRWVGSPMASLAYILWNIRTSGKCALMVDMATPMELNLTEKYKDPKLLRKQEDLLSIRDSFYLLMTMNQYGLNRRIRPKREAAGLLRITLFSKDLRLLKRAETSVDQQDADEVLAPLPAAATSLASSPGDRLESKQALCDLRRLLAQQLRKTRRRGVVPVFISVLWFLFSLAISIQSSFGEIGQNAAAHDLALGLLLSWLPVFILCSIVDRNPVSADDVQDKLNTLVDRVRTSLMDEEVRRLYLESIEDNKQRQPMQDWSQQIAEECRNMKVEGDFFTKFAGQGRVRWHYGVAHPILTDIENAYITEEGRDWLNQEYQVRNYLVLGKADDGLDWFDYRELWQIAAAIIIVVGCAAGAWFISFFTPTVGLGCRSGGYTVFVGAALGLLILEMAVWWIIDASKQRLKKAWKPLEASAANARQRILSLTSSHRPSNPELQGLPSSSNRAVDTTSSLTDAPDPDALADDHHKIQRFFHLYFFRPLEVMNTGCLCYLSLAQTLGADNNCDCMTSTWAPGGGYMDFSQWNVANSVFVKNFWIAGTTISCTIMGLAMLYIVLEWCLQSHLSTADINSASRGLQRTRNFRYALYTILLGAPDTRSHTSLRWHANVYKTAHYPHSAPLNASEAREHELRQTGTNTSQPPPDVVMPIEEEEGEEEDRPRWRRRESHSLGNSTNAILPVPQPTYSGGSSTEHSPLHSAGATPEPSESASLLVPNWRRSYMRRLSNESPTRRDEELGNLRPTGSN